MKYFEVEFTIGAPEEQLQDARDVLAALAGEAGFETFEDTPEGLKGYVQQSMFDEALLQQLTSAFPLPHCSIIYKVKEAEDRDWNEQWEQEGFEPIVVDGRLTIHDGRHLPTQATPLQIEIDAHLAFGTGTHETTRLMAQALIELDLKGARMLDCGTGTGILALVALTCGAAEAVGYDIDEWSVNNASHNAVINRLDAHFTPLLGDASVLSKLEGEFQVVAANINRNILLADMQSFLRVLAQGGVLLLSGFYASDVPLLVKAAEGLTLERETHEGDWTCLRFRK